MNNNSYITKIRILTPVIVGLIIAFSVDINAQQPNIFANAENLKVLPQDIPAEQLRSIMIGFTQALAVRCSTCHVGEDTQPITEYDFASDEKATKLIAREMLQLVNTINASVNSLDRGADHEFVEVSCVTCHRGQNRPRLIEDILAVELAEGGLAAFEAKYNELKTQHYGGFTYNFSGGMLGAFANNIATAGDMQLAQSIHDLNIRTFPNDPNVRFELVNMYQGVGDFESMLRALQEIKSMAPNYPNIDGLISRVEQMRAGRQQ